MQWPAKPSCHVISQVFTVAGAYSWREPRAGESYRTCSYCGCIHPEDLLRMLSEGNQLGGADWKYGWPHKLYMRPIFAKWYNEHLLDEGYDDEARAKLIEALRVQSGIVFVIEDGKLKYAAPRYNHQA